MELKTGILSFNYFKNLFLGKTQNILPFPIRVQKPVQEQRSGEKLPRCKPEDVGVSSKHIAQFLSEVSQNKTTLMHTAIIAREGKVICEAGFAPYTTEKWHVSHSLCKTFTGIAIGMLVDEGLLTTNEFICNIFPEKCSFFTPRRAKNITVEHLLTMQSGANFAEIGCTTEKDWVSSFFSYDCAFEPGTKIHYNSMNSYMLSAIVTKKTGKTLCEYLTEKLFKPLGFGSVAWETCPLDINKGGWGMYLFAEDAIKLGLLFLSGGVYNVKGEQKRIVSKEWIEKSTVCYAQEGVECSYGYQLWKHEQSNLYLFNGLFSQTVIVSPQLNMVMMYNSGSSDIFAIGPAFHMAVKFFERVENYEKENMLKTYLNTKALNYVLKNLEFNKPLSVPQNAVLQEAKDYFKDNFNPKKAKKIDEIKDKCNTLNGKVYNFAKCKFGLFPVVLSCMNDYYTKGLVQISFIYENENFCVIWAEEDSVHKIPIGFDKSQVNDLVFNGNIFTVATKGYFAKDEDGDMVLKLNVNFLESSSTQNIKLFFLENYLHVAMGESPNLIEVFRELSELSMSFIVPDTSVILKSNYISRLAHRFCYPSCTSLPIKDSNIGIIKNLDEIQFAKTNVII